MAENSRKKADITGRFFLFGAMIGLAFLVSIIFFKHPACASPASTVNLFSTSTETAVFNIQKKELKSRIEFHGWKDKIKIMIASSSVASDTQLEIIKLGQNIPSPWQLNRMSEAFRIVFNKAFLNKDKNYQIGLYADKNSDYARIIYYYNQAKNSWIPLATSQSPDKKFMIASFNQVDITIALFENKKMLSVGKASWYVFDKPGQIASPDYPIGSILRIYNLSNSKGARFVDAIVGDYGPNRRLHPDRAVDLEKTVFQKLASTSSGTIKVRVEPISVRAGGNRSSFSDLAAISSPSISARSAYLIDTKSNKVILSKDPKQKLPLASMTKLLAVKVFLDTKPKLSKIVTYKINDEENNFRYCKKSEANRLKLENGDKIMIIDLIYATLVGSHNNTMETLVRNSGLSRVKFISKMNELALKWEARSAHFIEPTGLSPHNVSSASDYAIIMKEVEKNPLIDKITSTRSYKFRTIKDKSIFNIRNTDQLLDTLRFQILLSKTGYLHEAGYCLGVIAQDKKGKQLTAVIFGAKTRQDSFRLAEDLLEFGFK